MECTERELDQLQDRLHPETIEIVLWMTTLLAEPHVMTTALHCSMSTFEILRLRCGVCEPIQIVLQHRPGHQVRQQLHRRLPGRGAHLLY